MLKLLGADQQNSASGFGSFLRNQRKANQITLRQLSADTGLDQPYLSRLERGHSPVPKPNRVNQIAESLCRNQGLSTGECNILKRQVLQQAGYLSKDEDLLTDLSNRFADKLRAMNIDEAYIVDALQKVPIDQMRKVLLGEEPLEVRNFYNVSNKEIETRQSHGEQVIALGRETHSSVDEQICTTLVDCLKDQHKVAIRYQGFGGSSSERVISPQRFSKKGEDSWYVDSWCDQSNAARSFRLDRIKSARKQGTITVEMTPDQLESDLKWQSQYEFAYIYKDDVAIVMQQIFGKEIPGDTDTPDVASQRSLENTDMESKENRTPATDYIQSHAHEFDSGLDISDSNTKKPSLSAQADPKTLAYIEGLHMEISGLQDQLMMMRKIRDEIGELQVHINKLDTVFKDVMGDR